MDIKKSLLTRLSSDQSFDYIDIKSWIEKYPVVLDAGFQKIIEYLINIGYIEPKKYSDHKKEWDYYFCFINNMHPRFEDCSFYFKITDLGANWLQEQKKISISVIALAFSAFTLVLTIIFGSANLNINIKEQEYLKQIQELKLQRDSLLKAFPKTSPNKI